MFLKLNCFLIATVYLQPWVQRWGRHVKGATAALPQQSVLLLSTSTGWILPTRVKTLQ